MISRDHSPVARQGNRGWPGLKSDRLSLVGVNHITKQ